MPKKELSKKQKSGFFIKHIKQVKSKEKEIICAFCKGKGKDPFGVPSKISNCQVCWGKGKVVIFDQLHKTCEACGGKGIFAHHRLPCSVCKGKGVVPEDGKKGKTGLNPDTGLPEIGCY